MQPKVLLSRKAFFSATRQLQLAQWDDARNQCAFGAAARLHGHDYVLEAVYGGAVSNEDGMIANIIDLKKVLLRVTETLDGQFLNDVLPNLPTLENIVHFIWQSLPTELGNGTLRRVHLEESRRLRIIKTATTMHLTRTYEFCAAHRLHSSALDEDENKRRYGKCSNPAGHGHNYVLDVTLEGTAHAQSGQIMPLPELDELVESAIIERFDHRHLNEDCPEFKDIVPTSENFARVIFSILQPSLEADTYQLAKIGLHETYKNYFEVER